MTTELRVAVRNASDTGGTAFTPVFTAFHDGKFDVYNIGEKASAGLEALAEDGNNDVIAAEVAAVDKDAQTLAVVGARGPIGTRELASTTVTVDGVSNGQLSVASMLLPSNDAFFGTGKAVELFDARGNFKGEQTLTFAGSNVLDAGTEVNTEMDAAFINQMGANTGITENGVVSAHPGFNGSAGNPGGDQIILGGTNAFMEFIDPVAADFTLPGAQIATVHVNTVATKTGTGRSEFLKGGKSDDFIDAGSGNDLIVSFGGWDVLNGEAGRDRIYAGSGDDVVDGGSGNDLLYGGSGFDDIVGGTGNDKIFGGSGNDNVQGGANNDWISGGSGNDVIAGDAGSDIIYGGSGDDIFVFGEGSDWDAVKDFDKRGDDRVMLSIDGVSSFDDVLKYAENARGRVELDFGGGDKLLLWGVSVSDLSADDFLFA